MTIPLGEDVRDLLADDASTKILTTVDGDGNPHTVVKQSLHLGADGNLHYRELLESSATNRNLVRSIWFGRSVAVLLVGRDRRSVQIKGRPVKLHVAGALFERHYREIRENHPDADLAGVWVIAPEEIIDQNPSRRREVEDERHPAFVHLDRLAG